MAFRLPVLEIAAGLLLLAGVFVRTAALSTAVLLAVFISSIASAWARGLRIDCGCFGDGGQVGAGQTAYGTELARDVGLLLLAVALARWPHSRLALGRAAGQPPPTTDLPHHDDHDDDSATQDREDRVNVAASTRREPTRAH